MAATFPTVISLIDDDDDDDDDVIEVLDRKRRRLDPPPSTAASLNPVATVLEIFPDADIQFVTETLEKYDQIADFAIAAMAENGYTKQRAQPNQKPAAKTEIDFMSIDSFHPTALYCEQVEALLSNEFSFLSVRGTREVLQLVRYHYALAHNRVWMASRGSPRITDELEQYRRMCKIQIGKHEEFIDDLKQALGAKTVIKKPRRKVKPLLTEATLVSEVKFVNKRVAGWMNELSTQNTRALNKAKTDKDGTGMDCSCCFDSFPIEDMIVCRNEGHLFCSECLKSFVENQIFGQGNLGVDKKTKKPALEIQCFSGDCNSVFDRTFLTRSLPVKTLEAYDKMQVTVNMTAAGLAEKVYSCPKCDFQAEVFPSLRVFSCSHCSYESCVQCGEDAHVPLRYDCVLLFISLCVSPRLFTQMR